MRVLVPGGHQITGVRVQSCRSQFAGVHMQLEGHIDGHIKGVAIDMTYIDALDMAKALIYAAHRHGDIAIKQAEAMVKQMNKKVGKK